jgi:elongation factor P--beta-lysine ligase
MCGGNPGKTGRGFSYNGKTLLSGIDPSGRAEKFADAVPVTDRTLYLCPSPLYGYGLERLLARLEAAPDSAVLCVEADPELFALSKGHFPPALNSNPKLRLTGNCEAGAVCTYVREEWGSRVFRRVVTVRLSGGWQLSPALYDTMAETLTREIALEWGNALTLTRLGRLYIRNVIRNLTLIPKYPSLEELSFGKAAGNNPVLVLGAGPSLDNFLDTLAGRFGETLEPRPFKIICVDTCLPALKARNITPDLAVILESQHWNLGDFTGLSLWKVPCAMDLSALPRSAEVLTGGLFLFFTPWTELKIFERLEAAGLLPLKLPPLGSVGLSAVATALRLSRGPVITAGLDFSFTLDSYHARSTPGHLKRLRLHNRFTPPFNPEAVYGGAAFKTISKSGDPVFSNPALTHYRNLFEREFSANAAADRLFDITGTGLPLGIKTLSPEEAVHVLKNFTPERTEKTPHRPLNLLKQVCSSSNSGHHLGSRHADFNQETQLDAVLPSVAPVPDPQSLVPSPRRMTVAEAFSRYAGFDLFAAVEKKGGLEAEARRLGLLPPAGSGIGELYDLIFIHAVEPKLKQDRLVALTDYPAFVPCLAKKNADGKTVERWELYYNGIELANCFSEETDPQEVRAFFESEAAAKESQALVKHKVDSEYWKYFQNDFPRCSGVAMGLDRLIMALCGRTTIDGVLPFPTDPRRGS